MKKNIGILIFIVSTFSFSSCVKLDEGPRYSLFTKKQRLSREWTIDSVDAIVNGDSIPLTNLDMKKIKLIFDKNGGLKYQEQNIDGMMNDFSTTWNWQLPGYLMETNFDQSQNYVISGNRKYIVKRLTKEKLILQDHVHGHRLYFHSH